ncbi:MAG TPA: MarR family transcriptional regulator [Oscillospiraceae bacterium]|nr:MarR family transcriptional regulator [Oscillospiraceae bacterium]
MTEFEENLNGLLVDTFNSILKYEETALKSITGSGVTVTEAHILEAIAKNNEHNTVGEIASSLGVAAPTITVAVKKLEKKGLVSKVPCPEDGRRMRVGLTDLGKRINRAHSIFHKKMVMDIDRDFSEEEKVVLLSAVKKLSLFFKEKVEDKK